MCAEDFRKLPFLAKFVLSSLPQTHVVLKKPYFPGLYPERGITKTIFACGGYGCCIISG
jgi:hypothetical protein